MTPAIIPFAAGEARLDWLALAEALAEGHRRPLAGLDDMLLRRGDDSLLVRAAAIDGLGMLVKAATVFPANAGRGLPTVNGSVCLFSDGTGALEALIDFHLVTKWKTAADSLLAALRLAPPRVACILIVGAGTVARSLRAAYGAAFPEAEFRVWNRTPAAAAQLAAAFPGTSAVTDLAGAVAAADIVTVATMAQTPVIRGAWLRPGQHLDLIGAYRPDMREADDEALRRARIFVDARATTLDHIGELMDPIARGVIRREDVVADFFDLPSGRFARTSEGEITLFKNGGGAHLDLITARYILARWQGG
jgi:ornithine cyclodeaminase